MGDRVDALEKERKYGSVQKLVFNLETSVSAEWGGPNVGKHYFVLPVMRLFQAVLGEHKKKQGYLTGVTLDLAVEHSAPVEFQLAAFASSPFFTTSLRQQFDVVAGRFSFAVAMPDQKPTMLTVDHDVMRPLVANVFDGPAVDGSYFGAPMQQSGDWSVRAWNVSRDDGEPVNVKHRLARLPFEKPVQGETLAGALVSERARLYASLEKPVSLSLDDKPIVLFGGFRPNYTLPRTESSQSQKAQSGYKSGAITGARLTLHCRF
jgi:hypothetical protein